MIPGVLSPETVVWCAEHRYPYLGLGTALPATAELWNIYGDTAAKEGYAGRLGKLRLSAARCRRRDRREGAKNSARRICLAVARARSRVPSIRCPRATIRKEATKRLARTMTAGSGGFLGVSAEQLGRSKANDEQTPAQSAAGRG